MIGVIRKDHSFTRKAGTKYVIDKQNSSIRRSRMLPTIEEQPVDRERGESAR